MFTSYLMQKAFGQHTPGTRIFNSLPNKKNLDWTKLKTFADDKMNLNEKLKLVFGKVENVVGKGENAGYHNFLLFPQRFQKPSLPLKSGW